LVRIFVFLQLVVVLHLSVRANALTSRTASGEVRLVHSGDISNGSREEGQNSYLMIKKKPEEVYIHRKTTFAVSQAPIGGHQRRSGRIDSTIRQVRFIRFSSYYFASMNCSSLHYVLSMCGAIIKRESAFWPARPLS
jgi:hypothetical protein